MALATAATAAFALAACGSSGGNSATGNSSDGNGARGVQGFSAGKTITYLTGAPGTPSAEVADALKDKMAAALHATINVRYSTEPSSTVSNQVATSQPNGLTIGSISPLVAVSSYVGPDHGGIGFAPDDVSYVGGLDNPPMLMVACSGSAYKSIKDVATTTNTVKVLSIPTGPGLEIPHLLSAAYGFKAQYVTGYTPATLVQGCERGDGDIATLGASTFLDASGTKMISGLTPLLLSGPVPQGSPNAFLNDTPTAAQFEKSTPPTTNSTQAAQIAATSYTSQVPEMAIFAPKGVPTSQIAELQAAMKAAADDPSVQKRLASAAAIAPGFSTGAQTLAFVKKFTQDETVIAKYVGQ